MRDHSGAGRFTCQCNRGILALMGVALHNLVRQENISMDRAEQKGFGRHSLRGRSWGRNEGGGRRRGQGRAREGRSRGRSEGGGGRGEAGEWRSGGGGRRRRRRRIKWPFTDQASQWLRPSCLEPHSTTHMSSSVVFVRNVIEINWTALSPGSVDSYMFPREFEVTVWLPRGYDGWDLTPIAQVVAQAVGLSADQVMRGNRIVISIISCLGGSLSAMVAAIVSGSGGGSRRSGNLTADYWICTIGFIPR